MTTPAALHGLGRAWSALWASVPHRTPFQHPAWLLPWWDVFGRGELRVLLVRDADTLIGFAPFYISPQRELRLLGAGVSDYLDALAAPAGERIVAGAISDELESSRSEWTFCGLDNLRDASLLLRVDAPTAVCATTAAVDPCPVVELPESVALLQQRIAPKLASHIRYSRRRAERLGGVTIERVVPQDLHAALDALFALHGTRWAAKGEAGVLSNDEVREFHRRAAAALQAAGLLRLLSVRIGKRIAAIHYGLHAGDRTFFYLGGFNPDFAALSPGSVAIASAMEDAIGEGASTFDFLGGREPYKYRWGAADCQRWSRHFRRDDPSPREQNSISS